MWRSLAGLWHTVPWPEHQCPRQGSLCSLAAGMKRRAPGSLEEVERCTWLTMGSETMAASAHALPA